MQDFHEKPQTSDNENPLSYTYGPLEKRYCKVFYQYFTFLFLWDGGFLAYTLAEQRKIQQSYTIVQ